MATTEQTQKKSYEANDNFLAIMKLCTKKSIGICENEILVKEQIKKLAEAEMCDAYRIVAGNFIFKTFGDRSLADMVALKMSPKEEKFRADWDNGKS